jgi:hypothetical protein
MRSSWRGFMMAAALMLAAPAVSPFAVAADIVGKVGKSVPAAFRMPPGGTEMLARRLDPIVRDEALETRAGGGLLVTFADNSELTLGANSSAVVDEFVYAGPGSGTSTINVAKGAFRFISGAMKEENVKINTPAVTIGIRGSELVGAEFKNGAFLLIMRTGLAQLVSKITGEVVDLPAGSAVAVGRDGRFSRVVQLATNRNADGSKAEEVLDALIDTAIFGEILDAGEDESSLILMFLESESPKRRMAGDDRYAFMSKAELLTYQLAYFLWEQGFFPNASDGADIAQSRTLGVMNRRTGAIGSLAGRLTRAARPGNRLNELPAGILLAGGNTTESEWIVTVGSQAVNYAEGTSYGPITAPGGGTIYSLNTDPSSSRSPPTNSINAASFAPTNGGNSVTMIKDFQLAAGQRIFSIQGLANFVTTEFPDFIGTQFNDDARIRLILPSGDVFDIPQERLFGASVNASTFTPVEGLPPPLAGSNPNNGGGQTGWKDFLQRLRVAPGGKVRVEVTVRNVGDQLYQSTILLNNVQGSGAR